MLKILNLTESSKTIKDISQNPVKQSKISYRIQQNNQRYLKELSKLLLILDYYVCLSLAECSKAYMRIQRCSFSSGVLYFKCHFNPVEHIILLWFYILFLFSKLAVRGCYGNILLWYGSVFIEVHWNSVH